MVGHAFDSPYVPSREDVGLQVDLANRRVVSAARRRGRRPGDVVIDARGDTRSASLATSSPLASRRAARLGS